MTRRMLINAQHPEELRIAITRDGCLETYHMTAAETSLERGNIYRGVVTSVKPALGAAFVDIGRDKDGLLRAEDVVASASRRGADKGPIDRLLDRGQSVLVQVVREGAGAKGSLLTTNISLAGRYLVLMPFEETRGVSRKVDEEEQRQKIRERLKDMNLPDGFGVIARTNASDQPKTALNRDLNALLRLWKRIRSEAGTGKGTRLLYSDQDLVVQTLRDSLDGTVEEVLVDDDDAYRQAAAYMKAFMPRARTRLVRYEERMPLFARYQVEDQIARLFERRVELPSGGSLVIDHAEALTAIDVNSGRSTRGGSQEETAYKTNLEAAVEVARQIRMRDIGGLLVVDFIDMRSSKHQREVEKTLRDAMREDKARFNVGRISPNGLLEINRQRVRAALRLRTHRPCPTCQGAGAIASPEIVGLNILRRIETRAVEGDVASARVELHPELADAIQNGRRREIARIEEEFGIHVEVIAAPDLHRSEERLSWVRGEPRETPDASRPTLTAADLGEEQQPAAMKAGKEQQPPPKTTGKEQRSAAKKAGPEGAEQPTEGEEPKRRRRGGRRRKRPGSSGGEPAAAGTDAEANASKDGSPDDDRRSRGPAKDDPREAAANGDASSPRQEESGTGDGGADSSAKPKSRRRRRRRRPKGDAAPKGDQTDNETQQG